LAQVTWSWAQAQSDSLKFLLETN